MFKKMLILNSLLGLHLLVIEILKITGSFHMKIKQLLIKILIN